MKKIFIILLQFLFASSYAQFFVTVDTASSWLPAPPLALKYFYINQYTLSTDAALLEEIKGYWTLEEAAGNAVDSVGTADLPVYGTVTRSQPGKIDNCYSFTTDGYLGGIDTYFEYTGSFTLSAWVKTSETGDGGYEIIGNKDQSLNRGYELIMWISTGTGNGQARFYVRGGWGTVQSVSTTYINDNAWHHVLGKYDADKDSTYIYVDGVLEDQDYSPNGPEYAAATFKIGSRGTQYFWEGSIDEPCTWNRGLPQNEIDSLNLPDQYPFTATSTGDSLRMIALGHDPRADTFRVQIQIDEYPDDEDDGTNFFAYGIADTADYNDTTFHFNLSPKDTTYYALHGSGLDPEDIWAYTYDTILVDSSGIYPPEQDYPSIFDTIFYQDFESHTGLPKLYDVTSFLADGWNPYQDSYYASHGLYRAMEDRYIGYTSYDSIIVDPISGSKVLKLSHATGSEGSHESGDVWKAQLDASYDELYLSYNIMIRPGWMWSGGGKMGPGPLGGTDFPHATGAPGYGEGFSDETAWHWDDRNGLDYDGVLYHYLYFQNQTGQYGEFIPWAEFQPVGDGMLNYNKWGMYQHKYPGFETDSVWFNITIRTVVNTFTGTTPNYDGFIETFVNGYLIGQKTGLYLITYPDKDKSMDWWYFAQFWGGGGAALRDEWSLFDDIWIFLYDDSVDVPRNHELSPNGRELSLPNWPKPTSE